MMFDGLTFGQVLRKHRKKAGLTLREMSESIGVSVMFLCDVERGLRNPFCDVSRVRRTAKLLGISPDLFEQLAAYERRPIQAYRQENTALRAIVAGYRAAVEEIRGHRSDYGDDDKSYPTFESGWRDGIDQALEVLEKVEGKDENR